MKIGVLTGGGDCPGLNAVIRAIVRKACDVKGDQVFGFYDAWDGVLEQRYVELTTKEVRGILPRGGTILGTRRAVLSTRTTVSKSARRLLKISILTH